VGRQPRQPFNPDGQPDLATGFGLRAGGVGKDHVGLGLAGRIGDGPQGVGPVAADQLFVAIDNHYGSGLDKGKMIRHWESYLRNI
jgi:hypothetical protein